jgi:hypothetical protein
VCDWRRFGLVHRHHPNKIRAPKVFDASTVCRYGLGSSVDVLRSYLWLSNTYMHIVACLLFHISCPCHSHCSDAIATAPTAPSDVSMDVHVALKTLDATAMAGNGQAQLEVATLVLWGDRRSVNPSAWSISTVEQAVSILRLLSHASPSSAASQLSPKPAYSHRAHVLLVLLYLSRLSAAQTLFPSDDAAVASLSVVRHPLPAALDAAIAVQDTVIAYQRCRTTSSSSSGSAPYVLWDVQSWSCFTCAEAYARIAQSATTSLSSPDFQIGQSVRLWETFQNQVVEGLYQQSPDQVEYLK